MYIFEDTEAWWEGFDSTRMKIIRIQIQTLLLPRTMCWCRHTTCHPCSRPSVKLQKLVEKLRPTSPAWLLKIQPQASWQCIHSESATQRGPKYSSTQASPIVQPTLLRTLIPLLIDPQEMAPTLRSIIAVRPPV